ncbi:NAD(P)-binding protein [Apiospora aurea]|uniref:NAD(P)-binding protein n=1 Tax=Apiospora aurea TaxID=335848 RepID=A0ABR1QK19_9PEZI
MSQDRPLARSQEPPQHPPSDLTFHNKSVLVTGANSGLGYAAAVKYAALGASLLILALAIEREVGEETKTKSKLEIVPLVLELSSFAPSSTASASASPDQKLDVVLLSAGVALPDFRTSADGYEMTTLVNVLSNTLLALLLLPKLRPAVSSGETSSPPHLCFLNSLASHVVEPEMLPPSGSGQTLLGRLNDRAKFDVTRHYYLAKLAAWFAIRGMIEHPPQNIRTRGNVIINACCPGMCRTNMQRDFPLVKRLMAKVSLLPLSRSAEEGSRSLISATGLGPESNGKLWRGDDFLRPGEMLDSERGQHLYRETWDEILKILKPHL